MEEWKEYKLDVVCKSIADGDHMPPPKVERGIPFVTISNIKDNRLDLSDTYFVPQKYYDALDSKRKPQMGDTIYSVVGTFGKPVYIKDNNPFVFQRHIAILRPDASLLNPLFLYYTLLSPQFYRKADIMAIGAVQRTISLTSLRNTTIQIPSLAVQKEIVSILKSLDDKIEVNRRINDNLEQQAQALFKSWFVDFETFKDGEFVESELGMIPKGWKVVELQDVVTIKRGGSPRPIQAFLSSSGYHWLKISDATACQSPYIYEIKEFIKESGLSKTVKLSVGSLVLSNSATPGIPKILGIDSCIHDGWLYFPHSHLSKYYLYMLFKEKRDFLLSQGNGSVFTNLKTDIVKAMQIAIPNNQIMAKFNTVVESLFNQIENKTKESRRLATLRDTLLPKLMSGELKVNEIEI